MLAFRRQGSAMKRTQSSRWPRRQEARRSRDMEPLPNLRYDRDGELGEIPITSQVADNPVSIVSSGAPSSRTALAATAWMDCATAMKDHDEAMVQGWKEEIDTHLVFAGLFSAILTAFNVEAYQMLLPDDDTSSSTSSTNELLRLIAINMAQTNGLISEVLSSGNTGSGGNNNWAGSFAVVINALWFCSLICSLAAASISILIKQWLNQYTSGIASVSPEIARIRQFRYDSLKKWRVAELMMLLPVLLQSAVVLFLLGLILFLSQLNKQITIAASTLIVLLLAFLFVTAILPTFISDCPYQSPQAWGVFVVVQAFKRPVRSIARSLEMYASRQLKVSSTKEGSFPRFRARVAKKFIRGIRRFAHKPTTFSWKARERIMVESKGSLLDQHLLIGADITFLDDTFLRDVIRPCLCAMPAKAAADCYANIMSHRADHVAASGVVYFDNHARLESAVVLTDITLDILQKLHEESDTAVDQHLTLSVLQTLEPLLIRALPMTYPHVCRVLIGLLDDDDKTVRQLAFQILYQHLSRNAQLAAQYASTGCHDYAAIVEFMDKSRADGDFEHFLNACDLLLSLATWVPPTAARATPEPDSPAVLGATVASSATSARARTYLHTTLEHLAHFFQSPAWRAKGTLLYQISRIARRLVALERRFPGALDGALVDVLADVAAAARAEDSDRNWEDKIMIIEATLDDLRALRDPPDGGEGSATTLHDSSDDARRGGPGPRTRRGGTRRPSFMRSPALVQLDFESE